MTDFPMPLWSDMLKDVRAYMINRTNASSFDDAVKKAKAGQDFLSGILYSISLVTRTCGNIDTNESCIHSSKIF